MSRRPGPAGGTLALLHRPCDVQPPRPALHAATPPTQPPARAAATRCPVPVAQPGAETRLALLRRAHAGLSTCSD